METSDYVEYLPHMSVRICVFNVGFKLRNSNESNYTMLNNIVPRCNVTATIIYIPQYTFVH